MCQANIKKKRFGQLTEYIICTMTHLDLIWPQFAVSLCVKKGLYVDVLLTVG